MYCITLLTMFLKQQGTFLLVDLQTSTVPYVAVVPDFWVQEGKCSYPKRRGEAAAMRRDKPNAKWLVYECIVRKQFSNYLIFKNITRHAN